MIGVRKLHHDQRWGIINMAINFLKRSKSELEKAAEDTKFLEVVEEMLGEIATLGD